MVVGIGPSGPISPLGWHRRCVKVASALTQLGISRGDVPREVGAAPRDTLIHINLKGFAIGNGLTDLTLQYKAYTDYFVKVLMEQSIAWLRILSLQHHFRFDNIYSWQDQLQR
ncbi:hypothetical protein L1887_20279 [Cichorium endivia]|nr:hypothetical protein L1887_20279 [Cichorium endivia]